MCMLLLFLAAIFLCGCDELETRRSSSSVDQSYIEINDIRIPIFSSAEEQLNYTRSWFADIHQKRAALEAFLKLYPDKKKYCGMAALDLAYLQLGKDYRFSYEYSSFAAIKDYLAVIEQYADYPDILAKAHWYIAWIYSDLLYDIDKGLEYYRLVVKNYPKQSVSLLPPAPWVSIIYPADPTAIALKNGPQNRWAALALVEIVRYSSDHEAWEAFTHLFKHYRQDPATGFGLRLALQKRLHPAEAKVMARKYMEKNFSNVHLLGDIRRQLNRIADFEAEGMP